MFVLYILDIQPSQTEELFMISTFKDIQIFAQDYRLPEIEVVSLTINLLGVRTNLPYQRVRFILVYGQVKLLFSVENSLKSPLWVVNGKMFIAGSSSDYLVTDLVEDRCEVIYTRKNGTVISFNPNNRSSCSGCLFCYQPASNDTKKINSESLLLFFEEWMDKNGLTSLSQIEQLALVTGCFHEELAAVDYLINIRQTLLSLGFDKEILYMGIVKEPSNIEKLSLIKPLNLVFTVECFDQRKLILRGTKYVDLDNLSKLMDVALKYGIYTNFSYIVGLDPLESIRSNFELLKRHVDVFPLVSVFQTDNRRRAIRTSKANNLDYYLQSRIIIQDVFEGSTLRPNGWNNHRSLWRTCYGENSEPIF